MHKTKILIGVALAFAAIVSIFGLAPSLLGQAGGTSQDGCGGMAPPALQTEDSTVAINPNNWKEPAILLEMEIITDEPRISFTDGNALRCGEGTLLQNDKQGCKAEDDSLTPSCGKGTILGADKNSCILITQSKEEEDQLLVSSTQQRETILDIVRGREARGADDLMGFETLADSSNDEVATGSPMQFFSMSVTDVSTIDLDANPLPLIPIQNKDQVLIPLLQNDLLRNGFVLTLQNGKWVPTPTWDQEKTTRMAKVISEVLVNENLQVEKTFLIEVEADDRTLLAYYNKADNLEVALVYGAPIGQLQLGEKQEMREWLDKLAAGQIDTTEFKE